MKDFNNYKQEDLLLKVNLNFNPSSLNLNEWENYLDILCGDRLYQIEAIKTSIVFLASKQYDKTEDLVEENFKNNFILQNKYDSLANMLSKLQVRNKLHANIELATGTGKSYVMFGIAQIMLAIGLVDRVLILCPSITIEKELNKKFLDLVSNEYLQESVPGNQGITNPSIIDANQTITKGDICIENIHAVYENTGSSIRDSFKIGGADTLVLNDEAHHVYNSLQGFSGGNLASNDLKRWKEFLVDPNINFKYILGFTGTAYIGNEYFNDVIYRFSLRSAVDNRFVKTIQYVREDSKNSEMYEKFQKINQNHIENKRKYNQLKPLTIIITKDIKSAESLHAELCDFFVEWEKIDITQAESKVLIVTSNSKHSSNLLKLETVDSQENSIEWIISVSMLTEGWDVKNVFQIVPWEDRAFNSKLLISQVLGRGLRIPEKLTGSNPSVIVFNHFNWSKNIRNLIDEVLEIEKRLHSNVITEGEKGDKNFDLYNIKYEKHEYEKKHDEVIKNLNYSKSWNDGINLTSQPDLLLREVGYENVFSGETVTRNYNIEYIKYSVDELVNRIILGFRTRDWEGGVLGLGDNEVYHKDKLPPISIIKEMITKSMIKVGIEGNYLSEENSNRVLRTFDTLFRTSSKTVVFENIPNMLDIISTSLINSESVGFSSIRRGTRVFYPDNYQDVITQQDRLDLFTEFLEDDSFSRGSSNVINRYLFNTPLNLVFTNESPEFEFTKHLCKHQNAKNINTWIKSRDVGFYQIEYSFRNGNHQKQKNFNPDFFLQCTVEGKQVIVVIEIKSDGDVSKENIAKQKHARKHFSLLNEMLLGSAIDQFYIFHFLSPKDYQTFFQFLDDGRLFKGEFKGELEVLLEETDVF